MTVWGWIAVAVSAFVGLSIAVGLVLAKILGSISAAVNLMFEEEGWQSAPLTREVKESGDELELRRRSERRAAQGRGTRS
jgi:hypothetical protein